VTPLFLWETSADGSHWTIQQAETLAIKLTAVRISLSAGTDASVKNPGMAIFSDFHLKAVGE
jgi:hypothetical protein